MKTKVYAPFLVSMFFCMTMNSNGQSPNWLWEKSIGGTVTQSVESMAMDAAGNLYLAGYFEGTADFDPGPGISNLTSSGQTDIFIYKLNNSGNFIWAKKIGGPLNDAAFSITLDASANIYLTGSFWDMVDFDPGAAVYNLTAIPSQPDMYVFKSDSACNFIWAKQISGTSAEIGISIAVDALQNVYTTGYFMDTTDFDPGTGVYSFISNGIYDIFVSKLDAPGNFVWAKQMGSSGLDYSNAITVDHNGNVLTAGGFEGTVDFDPGSGTFNLSTVASADAFISKLDNSGNFIWAGSMGGSSADAEAKSIVVDANDDIYTAGYFHGSTDFDPGTGVFNLVSAGDADAFISRLNPSGALVWAKQFGGTGLDIARCVFTDPSNGNVYSTGIYSDTADFDPASASAFNLVSAGYVDVFVSKLNGSGNFAWAKAIRGNYFESGKAILVDPSGFTYVTGGLLSLTAGFDTDSVENLNSVLNTETFFFAKLNNVITGIENNDNLSNHSIYPNPASSRFYIDLAGTNKKTDIIITDISGRVIYKTSSVQDNKIEINTENFDDGIYIIQIHSPEFTETKKLVVTKQ